MAIIKGKNLRFMFGGKGLYHATECSISISTKTDSIATKDTDGEVVTTSGYTYTLSTGSLVTTLPNGGTTHITQHDIIAAQLAGTQMGWSFASETDGGTKKYSGTAFISQSDLTASTDGNATASFSFTGSGNIAVADVAGTPGDD